MLFISRFPADQESERKHPNVVLLEHPRPFPAAVGRSISDQRRQESRRPVFLSSSLTAETRFARASSQSQSLPLVTSERHRHGQLDHSLSIPAPEELLRRSASGSTPSGEPGSTAAARSSAEVGTLSSPISTPSGRQSFGRRSDKLLLRVPKAADDASTRQRLSRLRRRGKRRRLGRTGTCHTPEELQELLWWLLRICRVVRSLSVLT